MSGCIEPQPISNYSRGIVHNKVIIKHAVIHDRYYYKLELSSTINIDVNYLKTVDVTEYDYNKYEQGDTIP